jgi:hypothetical protein
MLRKNVKDWIKHEKMLRESGAQISKKSRQRARYNRVRKSATKAIEDLTFLLKYLPEKQVAQVFSKRNMKPFLVALFELKGENRQRILELWSVVLMDLANTSYVANLVGRERWQLFIHQQPSRIQALEATVFFESV